MKKFLSIIASAFMALALFVGSGVTALADDGDVDSGMNGSGSITIKKSVKDEKYAIYKIFDATYSGENVAYTYDGSNTTFLNALQKATTLFKVTKNSQNTYNIEKVSTAKDADIISFIQGQKDNFGSAVKSDITGTGNDLKITKLKYGYYYITTTTGSLVTIDTDNPDAEVNDKNTVPSVDKKQSKSEGSYADADVDVKIGDTVYFQTEIKIGKGNDKTITLKDTMSEGLTLTPDSVVVKNGSSTLTANSDYTYMAGSSAGDPTFTIVISEDYVKAHNKANDTDATEGETLTVTYSAKINSSAAINNKADDTNHTGKNSNKVELTYSNQTTTDTVYETTEDFLLKKTDGTNYLPDAGFRLYTDVNCTQEVNLSADTVTTGTANKYHVNPDETTSAEIKVNSADGVNIRGLSAGDYYLKETTTPDGYSTAAVQKITVAANSTAEITVINNKGSELPSTGGIGTTIFYVAGGILIVGAASLLIARRKKEA